MKNSLMKKRIAAIAASAMMTVSAAAGTFSGIASDVVSSGTLIVRAAESSVNVLSTVGYNEGMYATWSSVTGASGYNVYVDGTQIDSMLIRQYAGYMRADMVGLKAGSHTMKIVPVINGKEDTSKAAETTASVAANDRSGFGFVNGTSSGAYNDDGTLRSGAIVLYVTNATKDSVKLDVITDSKGGTTSATGIQNILTAYQKGTDSRPLCIRCIGNITDPSTLMDGDLLIKGSGASKRLSNGVTIEGIGNDTVFNGFGLRIANASNVEVRNIGFMNCNSGEGDNVGLQQNNDHVWVHHCDMFYGDAGSDADQVKGDGALDTKTSSYITHSYNHFWDNGKCNLQGMKSESEENYITYHHNWYDHSDSRHPRIRTCTVHSYNNYFDGNSKYGVGVTMGASCFVENNYFRRCKYPMLISMQGSDIAYGTGTFSSEDGGIIKSFGNYMEGQKDYVTYQSNNTEFDAYEATSRSEQVPSSVKAKKGGTAYNNFDTASTMYSYTPDAAADVPAIVMAGAGRVDGGDFQWQFDNSADDESYAVNDALKAALVSYQGSVVAIGSGFKADDTPAPETTVKTTAQTTTAPVVYTTLVNTTAAQQVTAGDQIHDFTANGTSSSFYTISGNLSTAKGSVTYAGKTLTQCLKIETATSISFNAPSAGKLTLVFVEDAPTIKLDGTKLTGSGGIITTDVSAGSHTLTKADSANLFYMVYSGDGSAPVITTTATQGGQTTASTAPQGSGNINTSNIKLVTYGGWNEMMYLVVSGVKDADITGVSYSGPSSGTLQGDDFTYLVRDTSSGLRVDVLGLIPGKYSMTLTTSDGTTITKENINVTEQDRSGYAHFNYSDGVGAYTDNGTIKANAKVLYVTEENKNTVSVTSKDGTTVKGIGNILNSAGMESSGGKTANGGTANTNQGIIKKLAEDGTPLVVRFVGKVSAPAGVTEFDSVNYGGSVGDNGGMARMKSGKNITIEGVGNDAVVDGWGFHFMAESAAPVFGKSFEVRNIEFRNVPEDCIGMEGVQDGSKLTASVERCWIHNCEFYVPKIANPAESDKAEGDGACDFKRGQYFTNSYCYYEGYHKTNLVGASDSNLQFNLTYHHNYWKNCESRGPLARQANIHMYNNVFDGQTGYCQNTRANAYIFSEYNVFNSCKSPQRVDSGAIKSYNDYLNSCTKDMQAKVVSSKSDKVTSGNKYENFDTSSSLSYIPSGSYILDTNTGAALFTSLKSAFEKDGGCMDDMTISTDDLIVKKNGAADTTTAATTTTVNTTTSTVSETSATTTAAETTSTVISGDSLMGDANLDGKVTVADAVAILQHIALMDKYGLKGQALINADCYNPGDGVTAKDALAVQKLDAKVITELPELG